MSKATIKKRLEEAKKLPVASIEDIKKVPTGISKKLINAYLKDFVKPSGKCWLCEETLIVRWGIPHGIARCCTCDTDVRMYHYLKDEDGNEKRIEAPLQYHPKHYAIDEEETSND